ncbi:hypothetical protein C8R44DRAFT_210730 [Mycena epipterygia]|nr:hypothetical protein C8R44DRAFT_210730 [Mycena epipterygia]
MVYASLPGIQSPRRLHDTSTPVHLSYTDLDWPVLRIWMSFRRARIGHLRHPSSICLSRIWVSFNSGARVPSPASAAIRLARASTVHLHPFGFGGGRGGLGRLRPFAAIYICTQHVTFRIWLFVRTLMHTKILYR